MVNVWNSKITKNYIKYDNFFIKSINIINAYEINTYSMLLLLLLHLLLIYWRTNIII